MPRMLVEPRQIRDGGLVGCTGATMEDGTVYRATKRGHMEVDNVGHAKAMLRNEGNVMEATFNGAGADGVVCSGCGFGGFRFQRSRPCPRCGADCWEDA